MNYRLIFRLFGLLSFCFPISGLQAQETSPNHCCDIKTDSVVTLARVILPGSKSPQRITVGVKNGYAILDGDIILGRVKDLMRQSNAESSVAIDGSAYRWPNGKIPYTISSDFSEAYKNTILRAINYLDAKTNLCFVARDQETDYVTFRPGEGCSSNIGKTGGQQFINLLSTGCDVGRIVHELCHTAGLYHEQSREDRDTFVKVEWTNIEPGKENNFSQVSVGATDYGSYDYYAIMHYPANAFAIDPSKNTLTRLKPLPNTHGVVPINPPLSGSVGMGQRLGMTQGEIATINTLYPAACGADCQPPSWIVADGETWTWENVPNSGGFVFEIRVKGTGNWEVFDTPYNNQYYNVNITSFTTFEVRVKAKCEQSNTYSNYSKIFEFHYTVSECWPPDWITFSSITPNSAVATWESVWGISKYFLFHKKVTETTWKQDIVSNATQFTITGLDASTIYNVAVAAVCVENGVEQEGIALFSYLTTPMPCDAPKAPTATNVQAVSATIDWGTSGAGTYQLEIKRAVDATWINLGNVTGSARNVINLQPATLYQVRLSQVCSSNSISAPSPIAAFTTGQCPTPNTPVVSNVQSSTATLSWPAITGITTYKVELKRSTDATWTNLGNNSGNSRNLTNLQAATTYQARIQAVCSSSSNGQPSGVVSFTTGQCLPPTSLVVGNLQAASATAQWSSVTGVTTYKLEIKRTVDAAWTSLGNISATIYVINNLQSATTYQLRVSSACSNSSTSISSGIVSFTTGQCPTPGTPAANNITATSANIAWSSVGNGVTNYKLELKRSVDATWTNLGNSTGTSRSVGNLLPSTTYQVRVSSVCSSSSTGTPSNLGTFVTATCTPPNTPAVSNILASSATASWAAVNGISTYKVELKRSVDAIWTNLGNNNGTSFALVNLLPATTYQVRISSACSSSSTSIPSGTATFSTASSIVYDNPCSALTVVPQNNCTAIAMTTVGATSTANPVSPPSNCGTALLRDVWFRCQAPATGKVNIYTFPGTLTDGVIALYFGNECGNLTYYSCWDATGADEMPDIWASTTAGNWIYLRYWGYDGLVGTFSACVQIAPSATSDAVTTAAGTLDKHTSDDSALQRTTANEQDYAATTPLPIAPLHSLTISPNPVTAHLTFQLKDAIPIQRAEILGQNGRILVSQNLADDQPSYGLDIQGLPSGIYILRLYLGNESQVQGRFVKL